MIIRIFFFEYGFRLTHPLIPLFPREGRLDSTGNSVVFSLQEYQNISLMQLNQVSQP